MPYGETPYPKTRQAQKRLFDDILAAGRGGQSHAQIAEMIGIGRDTLQNWIKHKPELSRIMALADDYALAWWEALGQKQAETREGNSSVFIFVMKNRFGLDYGQDAPADQRSDRMSEIASLSSETRHALRALLRAEAAADHRDG